MKGRERRSGTRSATVKKVSFALGGDTEKRKAHTGGCKLTTGIGNGGTDTLAEDMRDDERSRLCL